MIYGEIKGLPKPLPRIIFGAMPLVDSDAATFALLDAVLDMGCYALDTAHVYGAGASEHVIGNWMASRGNRSEIIVIDKGAHPSGEVPRVDPRSIRNDIEESLDRLKTDYIDLYLLHRDDPTVPVGPIINVLTDLKSEGKITHFGASNWTHRRIEAANAYAQENGRSTFSVSSNQYSLAVQYEDPYPGTFSVNTGGDKAELAWYQHTQFPLLTWSSLARGFFSGKFARDNLENFSDKQSLLSLECYAKENNFLRLDRATLLAKEKGLTVPQIALSYLFHQPINCFTVTGSSSIVHFKKSVEALALDLSQEEVAWLNLEIDSLD